MAGFYVYFIVLADFGYHPALMFNIGDSFTHPVFGKNAYLVLTSPSTVGHKDKAHSSKLSGRGTNKLSSLGSDDGMFFDTVTYSGSSYDEKSLRVMEMDGTTAIKNGTQDLTFGDMLTNKMSCEISQPRPKAMAMFYYGSEETPASAPAEHAGCNINAGWPTQFPCYFDYAHRKYALVYAQTAYFTSIVVVQWADILICKTRTLSILEQKMNNCMMNFGIFSETALGCILCYAPFINALGTCPIWLYHWFAPMPFSMLIFLYDELRKAGIRRHDSINALSKAERKKEAKDKNVDIKDLPGTASVYGFGKWLRRNSYW